MADINSTIINVQDKKQRSLKQKIPKSILVLFLSSQLFFGFDFGFSSIFKKKYRLIVKRFSFLLSISMILILISPLNINYVYYWFDIIEYTSYFLVLNLTKYNAYHFIIDVNKIYILNRNDRKIFSFLGIYYNIVEFLAKVIFVIMVRKIDTIYTIIYYIPGIGLDIIAIVQIVLLYYIRFCARQLKAFLIASDVNFSNIEKYYVDIANCFDNIKPLYGRIVSKSFCYIIK